MDNERGQDVVETLDIQFLGRGKEGREGREGRGVGGVGGRK